MEAIKVEHSEFCLDDDCSHTCFTYKPEEDIFFEHFFDSPEMESIKSILRAVLLNFENYYFTAINFLINNQRENAIPQALIWSVDMYRVWYRCVMEKMPQTFCISQDVNTYHSAPIPISDLSLKVFQIETHHKTLLAKMQKFDAKWAKEVKEIFELVRMSWNRVELILKNTYCNGGGVYVPISRYLYEDVNITTMDNVTAMILSSFPAHIFEKLYQ